MLVVVVVVVLVAVGAALVGVAVVLFGGVNVVCCFMVQKGLQTWCLNVLHLPSYIHCFYYISLY